MSRPRKPAKHIQGGKRITVAPYTELGYACLVPPSRKPKSGEIPVSQWRWKTRVMGGSLITTKVIAADGKAGEDRVREILTERIKAAMNGHAAPPLVAAPVAPRTGTIATIADVREEYERAMIEHNGSELTKRGKTQRKVLRAACRVYFGDPRDRSKPLVIAFDAMAIRRQIIEVNRTSTLTSGTRQQYMGYLRSLFTYAVDAGYLATNPVTALKMPPRNSGRIERFTTDEVHALLDYCTEDPPPMFFDWREVWLAIRLQSLCGARAMEMLSIPRSRVTDTEFWLHGKGGKWRRFTMVILPELVRAAKRKGGELERKRLAWLQEIRSTVAELMTREAPRSGKLFRLTYDHYYDALLMAKAAKGLPEDKRNSHSLRKYAIHYWRTELHLPPEIQRDLAAHTEPVAVKHYLSDLTAEEQARAILLGKE